MIHLTIVTPERKLVDRQVDEVTLPGTEGYFGVLPGHAPLLSALDTGEIDYKEAGETHRVAVTRGFVEVLGDRVSVLADAAEKADAIDLARAKKALARAEQRLKGGGDIDWDRARASLDRAVVRIRVSEGK